MRITYVVATICVALLVGWLLWLDSYRVSTDPSGNIVRFRPLTGTTEVSSYIDNLGGDPHWRIVR